MKKGYRPCSEMAEIEVEETGSPRLYSVDSVLGGDDRPRLFPAMTHGLLDRKLKRQRYPYPYAASPG